MLREMIIKNLTVFPEANLRFSDGLNVFIGENGSGKSHILKAAYSMIAVGAEAGIKSGAGIPVKSLLQKEYAAKLINVFRPDALGRLVRRKQGGGRCELHLKFSDPVLWTGVGFSPASRTEVRITVLPGQWEENMPVFFPTRELLTIYPRFVSMYDSHYLEFEETWRDTCLLLGKPAFKGVRGETAAVLLAPLEQAMGGKVVLDNNGRFHLSVPGQATMEISLVAEGLRKLAMLAQLIGTGCLADGGYLFWDEPEANLNPRLIKTVARAILNLCKSGVQAFVATHSLFLLRELEILSRDDAFKKIPQRYFALPISGTGVEVEQGKAVDDLSSLVLLDEELSQSGRFMDSGYDDAAD